MRWQHRRAVAVMVAITFVAAGCGSTVRQAPAEGVAYEGGAIVGGQGADGQTGGGSGVGGATSATSGVGGAGSTAASAPTAPGGTTPGGVGAAPGGAAGGPAAGPPGAGADGGAPTGEGPTASPGDTAAAPAGSTDSIPAAHRAVTDDTIKVGFLYLGNAGAFIGASGAAGDYAQGDEPATFQAIVDDVNARGGVTGRQLQTVFHDLGGFDDAAYEAACAKFAQDDPVFMVFAGLGHHPLLGSCLAAGDVGYSTSYVGPPQALIEQARGLLWAPDELTSDNHWAMTISSLIDTGWFDGATIGVIWPEDPFEVDVLRQVVDPLLAAAGHTVAHEEFYPQDAGSLSAIPGQMFRMRANGVTHIVNFGGPLLHAPVAESQGYRPKWVVTSRMGPDFLGTGVPAAQLDGSSGPGWNAVADLRGPAARQQFNANDARCDQTLEDAGLRPADGAPLQVARMICGAVYHFEDGMGIATEVSAQGFRTAAESLGPRPSTIAYAIDHTGGRHDGVSAYRMLAYDAACQCYGYTDDTLHPARFR